MKKLFVIDAANYLFRSYFAIKHMTNQKGESTNALFGFIRSIEKIVQDFAPTHLVAVFDGPDNKVSRKALYQDYKAHRKRMPDDLVPQIGLAKQYCDLAGIPHLEIGGVEADDTMGSIAKWGSSQSFSVFLCSSDKDLCQLVDDKVFVLNTQKENLIIDKNKVEELFGVRPDQMVDYLAIMGDASDNIPGIKGFGEKTARELLAKFGSLDTILQHPEKLPSKKQQERVVEEKDNALLSKELAQIVTSVPISYDAEFYHLKKPNTEALRDLFHELNFHTFLKKLEVVHHAPPSKKHLIQDEEALKKLIHHLSSAKEICVDVETTSLTPMEAEVVGIGLGVKSEEGWYIPLNSSMKKEAALSLLTPLLENHKIGFIGHNIKYDMHALKNEGIQLSHLSFDTMIASYLLNSHLNRHNLDDLSLELFNHTKIPIESLIGTKKSTQISMLDVPLEQIKEYCLEDVEYTLKLKELFEKKLEERSLRSLFDTIEMPLLPILFQMERSGIFADVHYLEKLSKEFAHKIAHLEEKIYALVGKEFNLNSPKQLSSILFEDLAIKPGSKKTKTGHSTSADVLEDLVDAHPIIPLILEYRSLEKLRGTYIDALPTQINSETGRIHCSFHQSVTATGRLSCTNPNLQNIPIRTVEGKKIREAFKPEKENWSFFGADYSQIELRLLAHLSGEENLVEAFKNEEDVHKVTASFVFNVPLKEVTPEMRFRAKAVNFGIIYGQGAFGLSKEIGMSMKEATHFIETYFDRYPKVKEFIESCKESALKEGKTKTLLGRERSLPELNSPNPGLRAQALRFAVNSPIQGTQADIIKMAMISIDKMLKKENLEAFLILQIHDELIFECPDKEISLLQKWVPFCMENVLPLSVPLKVDISIGKNWGEC